MAVFAQCAGGEPRLRLPLGLAFGSSAQVAVLSVWRAAGAVSCRGLRGRRAAEFSEWEFCVVANQINGSAAK